MTTTAAAVTLTRPCPFPRPGTDGKELCPHSIEYMDGDGTWRCVIHGTLICPWPRQYPP